MTVANQTNRTSAVGSGVVSQVVPFSFPISATSDLTILKRVTATGVETTLTETTNYTVTITGDTGGSVTTVTAIEVTEEIHLIRDTPNTQNLTFVQGGPWNATRAESTWDKGVKLGIENKDVLTRTMRIPQTDSVSINMELPSSVDRDGKFLTFDANGEPAVTEEKTVGNAVISAYGETLIDDATAAAAQATLLLKDGSANLVINNLVTGSPFYNVKHPDYGAVGDSDGTTGDGTDDEAAVQLALNAVMVSGGTLYFPPGIYRMVGIVNALKTATSPVHITGEGILFFDQEDTIGLNVSGDDIIITNLEFRGKTLSQTATIGNSLLFLGTSGVTSDNIKVDNCTFRNCSSAGVFGFSLNGVSVTDCRFIDTKSGAQIKNSDYVTIADNQFITTFISDDQIFISGQDNASNHILITGNIIDKNGEANGAMVGSCIKIHNEVNNVLIADNILLNNFWSGAARNSENNAIEIDPKTHIGNCSNYTIRNNMIDNCWQGIKIEDYINRLFITGNMLNNIEQFGMLITSTSSTVSAIGLHVTDNYFRDVGNATEQTYNVIRIIGYSDVLVANNIITTYDAEECIRIGANDADPLATRITITGNSIFTAALTDATKDVLTLRNTGDVRITNNYIDSPAAFALDMGSITAGGLVRFTDNDIYNIATAIVSDVETFNYIIKDNMVDDTTMATWANGDATPDVMKDGVCKFFTGTTGVTVTRFDNGYQGQETTLISKGATVYDTTANPRLIGSSVDITTASGDITKWICDTDGDTSTSVWRLVAFVDVSADNSGGA